MDSNKKLFHDIHVFLDWHRDRPYHPPSINKGWTPEQRKRIREELEEDRTTTLQRQISHIYDSELWASPKGRHYHIDVAGCGIVSDPAYSDEYIIIPPTQVFKRQLQPCQCALQKEDLRG